VIIVDMRKVDGRRGNRGGLRLFFRRFAPDLRGRFVIFRRFDFQALRADCNGAAAAPSEKFGLIRRPEGA
jgi:hypothetical protein